MPACFVISFLKFDGSVLSLENHVDMACFKKFEQATYGKNICEQTRANLDKIQQVVAGPATIEQAVAGLAKFEPKVARPEVSCLVV